VEGARDAIETLVLGTKEEFGKADVELSKMANCFGERTEEMGTMTAFDMLGMLGEDSERLVPMEKYIHEHSAKWETVLIQKIAAQVKVAGGDPSDVWKNKFLNELKAEIEPLFRLYTKLSCTFRDYKGDGYTAGKTIRAIRGMARVEGRKPAGGLLDTGRGVAQR
jgi:hypothetical protein